MILKGILAFLATFGIYYLFGYFLSNESNILLWPWYGKLLYLWFGIITTGKVLEEIE